MYRAAPILQPSSFQNIPNEMRAYSNFVVWKFGHCVGGKITKIPYQVRSGQKASVVDPSHWSSFDDALAVAHNYDGIGFVFSENDPFAGIDLDDTKGDAIALEYQKTIFSQFGSYSEISPSGNGLHIIIKGSVTTGRRKGHVELYSSGRYFTMTGNVYNDMPIADRQYELDTLWAQIGEGKQSNPNAISSHGQSNEPDLAIIDRATNAENGKKFLALWNGNGSVLQGPDRSGSVIDQALVNIIQFYTQDAVQIERIWLSSPQGQRGKTQTRKDYRDRTIARAFDREIPNVEVIGIETIGPNKNDNAIEAPRPLRREMPPAVSFPIGELGEALGDAAKAIIYKVQCPDAVAAMSVLGVASLCCQGHADVIIPATGHAKPLSLYLVTIAASGERKSAADTEALSPVRAFERELQTSHDAEYPSYLNKLEAWQAEREKIKRNRKNDMIEKHELFEKLGAIPESPLTPILTCPEPTFEGLCKLYIDGIPMLGIFSDEGGQFVGGYGLSNDSRLRTISGLSAFWDGTAAKRVRATDGVSVLYGRRLALHLMMQPDVAATLLSDPMLKDQGFLSRILVAAPDSTVGTRFQKRSTAHHGDTALLNYHLLILNILRQKPKMALGKRNELEPRALTMDATAASVWMNYADDVERRLGKSGSFDTIKGFANKLPEHAARLAGVLALVDDFNASLINKDLLVRGIKIAEYFASEALRLFDAGMATPEIRMAESLLDWLQHKWQEPSIGLQVIYQKGPSAIRGAATAKRIVAILADHGWLTRAPQGTKVAGVAVREAWSVIRAPGPGVATPANSLTPPPK